MSTTLSADGTRILESIRQTLDTLKEHDKSNPTEGMYLTVEIIQHIRSWKSQALLVVTSPELG